MAVYIWKKTDLMSTVTMETGSVEIHTFQIVPNVRKFRHGKHGNED